MAPAFGSPYKPRNVPTGGGTTSISPYAAAGLASLRDLDTYNQKRLNLPLTRAKTGGRVQSNAIQDALMRLIR